MALDVYFQDDIAANLVATGVGMLSAAAAHGCANVEYCRGVLDALRAQAVAYRIPWPDVKAQLQAALADRGLEALLESATRSLVLPR